MAESIAEMLAMETAEPDATLTPLDVFEEKSKDADDAIEYGMGLSQEELLDIVMSVTPMGSVKAGKGAISFLKGLLGKFKSRNIAKPNRRETEKIMSKLMKSVEPDEAFEESVSQYEKGKVMKKLIKSVEPDEAFMGDVAEYEKLKGLVKPKGMRQFGKFNRQLNDPEYVYQKNKTSFDKEVERTLRKLKKHNDEMGYDTFEKMVEKIK